MTVLIAVFAIVAALVALYRADHNRREVFRRLEALEHLQRRHSETVKGLSAGAVSQGEQVVRLEQELRRLKERLTGIASRESSGEMFEQAIRMAQRGVSRDDIMQTCGLSLVEADLVILLHRQNSQD
ncbi:MAG: DUF2802 domain-containing protein [Ectothiorhodospiraceae bacterium]|nr:DUF2802 domain-containing protein [Ectothiorhodospiraceae bacterium]MCH8504550.1 DUF2802 domain-containing protein [Ectothiorhodospiraceae bacterium]